jgi:hypothetical protein
MHTNTVPSPSNTPTMSIEKFLYKIIPNARKSLRVIIIYFQGNLIPFRTILILSKLRKNKEKIMGKVAQKKEIIM